ncbi:MAG TPA: hypothetical protein VF800_06240 [Telluria sp.]|jgi:hypothetical protein
MKKTSLRKNRFATWPMRLVDGPVTIDRKTNAILMANMMEKWDDADIVERMTAALSRPISAQAQAFYDHIDAVLEGRASIGDPLKPAVGEVA